MLFLSHSLQMAVPSGEYQHPWPTASQPCDRITNIAPAPEYSTVQSQNMAIVVEIVDSKSPLVFLQVIANVPALVSRMSSACNVSSLASKIVVISRSLSCLVSGSLFWFLPVPPP